MNEKWRFNLKKFLLWELVSAAFITNAWHSQVQMHGNSGRLIVLGGVFFVLLSGFNYLVVRRNEKNELGGYWIVTILSFLMAFGMGAFSLWRLLKHHDFEMQLFGWMLFTISPMPWIITVFGNLVLKNRIRRSDLSLDSQEVILSLAARSSAAVLFFVFAIICGFTSILSFYLK